MRVNLQQFYFWLKKEGSEYIASTQYKFCGNCKRGQAESSGRIAMKIGCKLGPCSQKYIQKMNRTLKFEI